MGKRRLFPVLRTAIILHFAACGGIAHAQSLTEAMTQAATQIIAVMKDKKIPNLEIGEFTPSRVNPANGGPGLQKAIIDALEAQQKGIVQQKASVVLIAKFRVVGDEKDKQGKFIREKVTFELLDEEDELIGGRITTFFNRLQDIAQTEGITGSLDLDDDTRAQHEDLKKRINKPRASIMDLPDGPVKGTLIKSSPDGKYAIEIATKSIAEAKRQSVLAYPLPATVQNGLAEVEIAIQDVYEVRVYNFSDEEIAVQLTVDGLDLFTFSKDRDTTTRKPMFSHMIVAPRDTITIPGWHNTIDPNSDENFISFLVTKLGQGAAGKLPLLARGKIGVITVSVSLAHQVGSGKSRSSAETGFGPPLKRSQKVVKRTIDPAHDFISVRYAR